MDYLEQAVGNSTELAQIQDLYEAEMLAEEQEYGQDFDEDGSGLFDMRW
jgi:hypothetical protein